MRSTYTWDPDNEADKVLSAAVNVNVGLQQCEKNFRNLGRVFTKKLANILKKGNSYSAGPERIK